jgi:hypothetical protein
MTQGPAAEAAYESQNAVTLRGVLADTAVGRVLPSGDELCSFRVTVPRPPGGRVVPVA